MKQLFLLSLVAVFLTACNNDETKTKEDNSSEGKAEKVSELTNYDVDTESSVLKWKGDMIGVYAHTGDLKFESGSLSIKGSKVESGSFSVDMTSMITTDDDANYENAPREKLIAHLQADDFFAVESFPTSIFTVKSMENGVLTGDLTIRGITHSEEVKDVEIKETDGVLTASGKLVFDRQKYEVVYESKMKDMVLSDDIELVIELTGKSK